MASESPEITIEECATRAGQASTPYVDALVAYASRRPTRFDVPGHKGGRGAPEGVMRALGTGCYDLDVPPLLRDIDVGPDSPLRNARRLAAQAWGADTTWFLTNGASQGNLVALLAIASLGRVLAVQRNAHSSVTDGIILAGLEPRFLAPGLDARLGIAHVVSPDVVARALEEPGEVSAVHVTSPTYFGAVADVPGLAAAAHAAGIPLIVDESWGGHFGFHPALPPSALAGGADLVVSSTHKMVGSLTQSAMLHLGHGALGARLAPAIESSLRMVGSTSTSSVLLASLDGARMQAATDGESRLAELLPGLRRLSAAIDGVPGVSVANRRIAGAPGVVGHDPLRVVIDVTDTGLTGYQVGDRLRDEHGVDVEVKSHGAVVVVVGMAELGLERAGAALVGGLAAIAADSHRTGPSPTLLAPPWGPLAMTPREAFFARHELIALADGTERISADTLSAYPPGIPNVLPGERLTGQVVDYLRATIESGGYVRGAEDSPEHRIRVLQ
jgi:arginine decarboxylase